MQADDLLIRDAISASDICTGEVIDLLPVIDVFNIIAVIAQESIDNAQQLLGVKSPAEFLELSSAHFRKQLETFAGQSKHLTGMAQKMTAHAVEPLQAGMKNALSKTA